MKLKKFVLGITDLSLQDGELLVGLIPVEVKFGLGVEFLLGDLEELDISETEGTLDIGDLLAEGVIFKFYRGKVIQTSQFRLFSLNL